MTCVPWNRKLGVVVNAFQTAIGSPLMKDEEIAAEIRSVGGPGAENVPDLVLEKTAMEMCAIAEERRFYARKVGAPPANGSSYVVVGRHPASNRMHAVAIRDGLLFPGWPHEPRAACDGAIDPFLSKKDRSYYEVASGSAGA